LLTVVNSYLLCDDNAGSAFFLKNSIVAITSALDGAKLNTFF